MPNASNISAISVNAPIQDFNVFNPFMSDSPLSQLQMHHAQVTNRNVATTKYGLTIQGHAQYWPIPSGYAQFSGGSRFDVGARGALSALLIRQAKRPSERRPLV
jgi:hypothetical protein